MKSRAAWTPVASVPGFACPEEKLNVDDEKNLVRCIEAEGRWVQDYTRKAQRHAYDYVHRAHALKRIGELPSWLLVWARFIYEQGWMIQVADQATVHEYVPGVGIGDHIDDRWCFPGDIVTISLLSTCRYRLIHTATRRIYTPIVPPRAVVVLQGEARSDWKHGIPRFGPDCLPGEPSRRLSITFRTINPTRVVK